MYVCVSACMHECEQFNEWEREKERNVGHKPHLNTFSPSQYLFYFNCDYFNFICLLQFLFDRNEEHYGTCSNKHGVDMDALRAFFQDVQKIPAISELVNSLYYCAHLYTYCFLMLKSWSLNVVREQFVRSFLKDSKFMYYTISLLE